MQDAVGEEIVDLAPGFAQDFQGLWDYTHKLSPTRYKDEMFSWAYENLIYKGIRGVSFYRSLQGLHD